MDFSEFSDSLPPHLSDLSSSPPKLDPSTLALLDSFFAEKAETEHRFKEIVGTQTAADIAGLDFPGDSQQEKEKPMISVSDFLLAFGEDWQLSQFWYTDSFATNLARNLHMLCDGSTKIAFVCCPTAFVAFQREKPLQGARLLEYDQRFAALSPGQFIPYNVNEPDDIPDSIKECFDIVIVDPPYLNEITNAKVAKTLPQILKADGKLIVITSTSVKDVLKEIYSKPPLGPLRRAALTVEHSKLANDFACWGSWDGAEEWGRQ